MRGSRALFDATERGFGRVIIGGRIVVIIELQETHFIKNIGYCQEVIFLSSNDLGNEHDSKERAIRMLTVVAPPFHGISPIPIDPLFRAVTAQGAGRFGGDLLLVPPLRAA